MLSYKNVCLGLNIYSMYAINLAVFLKAVYCTFCMLHHRSFFLSLCKLLQKYSDFLSKLVIKCYYNTVPLFPYNCQQVTVSRGHYSRREREKKRKIVKLVLEKFILLFAFVHINIFYDLSSA